jgi:hypothetical protein
MKSIRLWVIAASVAAAACSSSQSTVGSSAAPSQAPSSAPVRSPSSVPSASAATASASAAPATFPVVVGTRFTFRGKKRNGDDDTWTTEIVAKGKDRFQYEPHHNVANWFSKGGFSVISGGILIGGETLDEPAPTLSLAIPFPLAKGTSNEVPGLFPTKYLVVGPEKITVPAGSFDAWKVSITDSANPEGAAWIAPGTGIVKIQLPSGRIDELVSIQPPP